MAACSPLAKLLHRYGLKTNKRYRNKNCSQGGVKFPTGGESPRALPETEGQQIRCNSGADGIVRMEENREHVASCGAVCTLIVLWDQAMLLREVPK